MSKMSLSCFFFFFFLCVKKPTLWFFEAGPVQRPPNCSPLRLSFLLSLFQTVFFLGSERKCSCVESFGLNEKNQPIWLTFLAKAIIFCCQGLTSRPAQFLGSSHLYQTRQWGLSSSHITRRGPIACLPKMWKNLGVQT